MPPETKKLKQSFVFSMSFLGASRKTVRPPEEDLREVSANIKIITLKGF